MLGAVAYTQELNPLGFSVLSTVVAALPVLVLFYLLVVRGMLASKAGAVGALIIYGTEPGELRRGRGEWLARSVRPADRLRADPAAGQVRDTLARTRQRDSRRSR